MKLGEQNWAIITDDGYVAGDGDTSCIFGSEKSAREELERAGDYLRKLNKSDALEVAMVQLIRPTTAPPSNSLNLKCVRCDKPLKTYDENSDSPANRDMWDDCVVHDIVGGFGSRYDMAGIIVGVCDECLDGLTKTGAAVVFHNYFDDIRPSGVARRGQK